MDITLQLKATATEDGFDILAISEGEAKGHGITFSTAVLQEAMPLDDGIPVFVDHVGLNANQSVRNLAGTLNLPTWNDLERGIQLKLKPAGPAGHVLQIICGQFSSMHLLQMLVTGLIKRSPKGSMFSQGGRGKYSITEFGRKALDMFGPRTFPPEWGRTHKKRVVMTEFKLNPFWVKHAKKYYW